MRKKNFKGRCEKRVIPKCSEVCRTYDAIQYAYADLLQADSNIKEIRCNVLSDGLEEGDYMGVLSERYPSFYQFRYFYRKTKNLQNFYISREGLKSYQRNNRPLTGEGIQEFAPVAGTGLLDATVCDIYLINDVGNLVGRPILTACIDAYSGLCCGYTSKQPIG